MSYFQNRRDAGQQLARHFLELGNDLRNPLVLGLARGGVPVAFEVSRALQAPLDVFIVRKLGLPEQPEFAIGAVASGGVRILNEQAIERHAISDATIAALALTEERELQHREQLYRKGALPIPLNGHDVLLVDDGLATGASMRAAIAAVRRKAPRKLFVGVPVGAEDTCESLAPLDDSLICLCTPDPFHAVSLWYESFPQTSHEEVQEFLLAKEGETHGTQKLRSLRESVR